MPNRDKYSVKMWKRGFKTAKANDIWALSQGSVLGLIAPSQISHPRTAVSAALSTSGFFKIYFYCSPKLTFVSERKKKSPGFALQQPALVVMTAQQEGCSSAACRLCPVSATSPRLQLIPRFNGKYTADVERLLGKSTAFTVEKKANIFQTVLSVVFHVPCCPLYIVELALTWQSYEPL